MPETNKKTIKLTTINGEEFLMIENVDHQRPFFMSMASASNHWMFISSNGGLTAGRRNAEYALFPYTTDDKVTESSEITGSKTNFFSFCILMMVLLPVISEDSVTLSSVV